MMNKFEKLTAYLNEQGVVLSDKQISQFNIYFDLLIETNKSFNLTAITELHEVEEKHFMDSVAPVSLIDFAKYNSLIDIGTGAGFPGLPLKIVFPNLKTVLVDATAKKINFLNILICRLELSDIFAIQGRAEELGRKSDYREQFELCVSRAVSNLASLSELCLPFVSKEGFFFPYKTQTAEEEIIAAKSAVAKLGGEITDTATISVGASKLNRFFPVIKKVKNTPPQYPRKNGTPQKNPLS